MSYATAAEIAKALGARRSGRGWMACCPAHDDRSPSFSISDAGQGRPLVYCFSGCDQRAVIGALRARGLWGASDGVTDASRPLGVTYRADEAKAEDEARRTREALEVWNACAPLRGSPAEAYIRARGVTLMPRTCADVLRYAPRLRHHTGHAGPALVAALHDGRGRLVAIQRTWLKPDGSGKAEIMPNKMTLGPMSDAAVKLGPVTERLGLAEGIETALSATQLYAWPVWACLSAMRLSAVTPPPTVREIIIFADAGKVGTEEAFKAQDHYEGKGYAVEVITPQADFAAGVSDFNDALRARAS